MNIFPRCGWGHGHFFIFDSSIRLARDLNKEKNPTSYTKEEEEAGTTIQARCLLSFWFCQISQ